MLPLVLTKILSSKRKYLTEKKFRKNIPQKKPKYAKQFIVFECVQLGYKFNLGLVLPSKLDTIQV